MKPYTVYVQESFERTVGGERLAWVEFTPKATVNARSVAAALAEAVRRFGRNAAVGKAHNPTGAPHAATH